MYQLEGSIKLINDTQTYPSGFSKREFVITTEEKYPQDVKFECVKDKVALLDDVNPGDSLIVHFRIRGNEYQGKYYVNLQAWKIERGEGGGSASDPSATPIEEPRGSTSADGTTEDPFADEEIPF